MPLACFVANSNVSVHWKHAKGMSLRYDVIVLGLTVASYQEIIISSGVFRRETASGFYPFGDATDLAGEGGVGDVVRLIQAPA